MIFMVWHREEPGIFDAYHPRSVDDVRRIRFEQTRTLKGLFFTFLLKWRWQLFSVSADGPHRFPPVPGGTAAWMDLRVFLLNAEDDFPGQETMDEDVMMIAIEALIVHGRNGEGLRHPDRTYSVLHGQRMYSLGESGTLQVRDCGVDEQRGFREQRDSVVNFF
jgi:hypothetical protein